MVVVFGGRQYALSLSDVPQQTADLDASVVNRLCVPKTPSGQIRADHETSRARVLALPAHAAWLLGSMMVRLVTESANRIVATPLRADANTETRTEDATESPSSGPRVPMVQSTDLRDGDDVTA